MANQYLDLLKPWRDMLDSGLTTFAEKPDPTRSDCHAWSASPNYDFLATVAGIMPNSPGFRSVRIAPAMGDLKQIDAKMPHPNGEISVSIRKSGKKLLVKIELPDEIKGVFEWMESTTKLNPGVNEFQVLNKNTGKQKGRR